MLSRPWLHPVHDRLIRPDCDFHKYTALSPTTDHHLRFMSNCVLANASLCSSEHRIFCGLSLLRHSYVCHSIELQPLKNLFRLPDCLDDCCLVLSHNRNSSSGHLATHLNHRHLRSTHWHCGDLMLHHHGNTGGLVSKGFQAIEFVHLLALICRRGLLVHDSNLLLAVVRRTSATSDS